MKREELYHKTVDILVQAYLNDTLAHGFTCGCAVGNLVADAKGYKVVSDHNGMAWDVGGGRTKGSVWNRAFCTYYGNQVVYTHDYVGEAKDEIDSTGYGLIDLAAIESAFECAEPGDSDDEYMFNGLMAVIDCLDKIHENNDQDLSTASKGKFVKELG